MKLPTYTDAQWAFLYGLHLDGYSIQELAAWVYVSPKTLFYNFRRLGLTRPREQCEPLDTHAEHFQALGDN